MSAECWPVTRFIWCSQGQKSHFMSTSRQHEFKNDMTDRKMSVCLSSWTPETKSRTSHHCLCVFICSLFCFFPAAELSSPTCFHFILSLFSCYTFIQDGCRADRQRIQIDLTVNELKCYWKCVLAWVLLETECVSVSSCVSGRLSLMGLKLSAFFTTAASEAQFGADGSALRVTASETAETLPDLGGSVTLWSINLCSVKYTQSCSKSS